MNSEDELVDADEVLEAFEGFEDGPSVEEELAEESKDNKELVQGSLPWLFESLRRTRARRKQLDKAADELKKVEKAYEKQVHEVLDTLDVKSQKTGEGVVFTRMQRIQGSVKADDRETFMQTLDDLGLVSEFTKTDFRQAKLNEMAKACLEEGKDLPKGLDYFTIDTVRVTEPKG